MERVFDRYGVERTFRVGPGDHSGVYGVPYFREQLEGQYANVRHWDGASTGRPDPERFDYRTVRTRLHDLGLARSTWTGSRSSSSTSPTCRARRSRSAGRGGSRSPHRAVRDGRGDSSTFVVDLGPSQPVDEPAGLGTSRGYGRTVTVALTALSG